MIRKCSYSMRTNVFLIGISLFAGNLWPHEDPDSDRIVEQLMFMPLNSTGPLKKIFLHRDAWGRLPLGQAVFLRDNCPVNRCTITDDAEEAHALLFKDRDLLQAVGGRISAVQGVGSISDVRGIVSPSPLHIGEDDRVRLEREKATAFVDHRLWATTMTTTEKGRSLRSNFLFCANRRIGDDRQGVCGIARPSGPLVVTQTGEKIPVVSHLLRHPRTPVQAQKEMPPGAGEMSMTPARADDQAVMHVRDLHGLRLLAQDVHRTASGVLQGCGPSLHRDAPWYSPPPGSRHPDQVYILYMLECPMHTPGFRDLGPVFNWTATYRHDSDLVAPYEKWVPYPDVTEDPTLEEVPASIFESRTKDVAWFVSNCNARNNRLQFARKLGAYINVDVYGACSDKKCPRYNDKCFKMLDTTYKFYLAFENSNCKDYITEKFFVNGLNHSVVPVVMGARKSEYRRAAPANSFIHVDDFRSPKELADHLRMISQNRRLWEGFLRSRRRGEMVNTYFFCRLCAMLHDDIPRKVYPDIHAWWAGPDVCTTRRWDTEPPPPPNREPAYVFL
ncbi:fucosyltransferase-like [Tropilaelaps mercedesae]|uniref:Fucosyltransferase n=1 Tax=Tropilaelaps mercedesae TaxID=418985 RepID=A0A1V9XB55_9ACAR|nr:fucosyltransferase-like [Tropilaelaps mercedesae]